MEKIDTWCIQHKKHKSRNKQRKEKTHWILEQGHGNVDVDVDQQVRLVVETPSH